MALITPLARPAGKKILMMSTCLCDAFYDDAARAMVEILEHLGVEVVFPAAQTCCGQPAFNSGDWEASRKVVRHTVKVFAGDLPVVVPSGSCAAMLFHGAPLAFENEADRQAVQQLASRSWELIDYIVNGLGVKQWPGSFEGRLALHEPCHTRGTATIAACRQLLGSVKGVELTDFEEKGQCCGFGGTFSVTFPGVCASLGRLKVDSVLKSRPDFVVSPDMSCLMHQRGLAEKAGIKDYRTLHVAQVLRDALRKTVAASTTPSA